MNTNESNPTGGQELTAPTTSTPAEPAVPGATVPSTAFSDAKAREQLRNQLRAEEWAMHCELMQASRLVLKNLTENPHKHTVADLARLMELASKLGRLATESQSGFESNGESTTVLIQFEAALKKVYARRQAEGKPLPPGAVIDVEPVKESTTSHSAANGEKAA